MPTKRDLTGKSFGKLTVIMEAGRDQWGAVMWHCICACGRNHNVKGTSLTDGRARSCGCGVAIRAKETQTTHGMSGSPLYMRWRAMLERTGNPNNAEYHNYGGRGINVCDRWRSFEAFQEDMAAEFAPHLELDRVDVNDGYSPRNCRWATSVQQQRNRRNNHVVTWRGRTMVVEEWGELLGLKPNTIITRLRRDWDLDRAMSKGVRADVLLEVANR